MYALHGEERDVGIDDEVEEAHQSPVPYAGERPELRLEVQEAVAGTVGEALQGDRGAQELVIGLEHLSRRSSPELAFQLVAIGKDQAWRHLWESHGAEGR